MTKKLTENQYQLLVSSVDRQETLDSIVSLVENFASVELGSTDKDTLFKIMALANPKTRDTAHGKYVEKENKYIWNLEISVQSPYVKRLVRKDDTSGSSLISEYLADKKDVYFVKEEILTESEIRAWGYAPEAFERVEVK